jgi:hypothetical protein
MGLISMGKSTARYAKVELDVLQPLNNPPSEFCQEVYCAQIVGANIGFWTLGAPIECESSQGFSHPECYGDHLKCVTCPGCETKVEGEELVKLYHRRAYQLVKAMNKWMAGTEPGSTAFSAKWEDHDFSCVAGVPQGYPRMLAKVGLKGSEEVRPTARVS